MTEVFLQTGLFHRGIIHLMYKQQTVNMSLSVSLVHSHWEQFLSAASSYQKKRLNKSSVCPLIVTAPRFVSLK